MRNRLVGDIETDGFLDACTQIHCIVLYDLDTDEYLRFNSLPVGERAEGTGSIQVAIDLMNGADELYFHYGHGFDYPAILKLHPDFNPKRGSMFDTVDMSKALYRDIEFTDIDRIKKKRYPAEFDNKMIGSYSLKAWGMRLGEHKTSIAGDSGETDWSVWTMDMEDYCVQDVVVTVKLLKIILSDKNLAKHPMECHRLDNAFQHLMARQERHGFKFDQDKAVALMGEMSQMLHERQHELTQIFKPFYKAGKLFTPKRDNLKNGYTAGVEFTKVALTEFNPGSRDHIQLRLQRLYGWEPKAWGKDGKATVDESVLAGLRHLPPVARLLEYLTLKKRVGMLATGKQNWMDKVTPEGRIHGRINAMGAVTWRCTHSSPNMGQIPGANYGSDGELLRGMAGGYGSECRELFTVPTGSKLVGHDGSGLELRCLGHYLYRYDGGDYASEVINGDVHTRNQRAIGLNQRANAKTWIYAYLYGAGPFTLGLTVLADLPEEQRKAFFEKYGSAGTLFEDNVARLGEDSKSNIVRSIPALGQLITDVKKKARKTKKLTGLDGRELVVRSQHAALNTLLQSAGALIMKRWLVIADNDLQDAGLVPHQFARDNAESHYEYVANVHDEAQTEVIDSKVEAYDAIALAAFNKAGEYYNFRCQIDGAGGSGATWLDTH